MPGGTRWKQEKFNCCLYFDRWPVCMAAVMEALESKRKRGFWYGRYRCRHFDDAGRIPSVCVYLRRHGGDGKLPLCRNRRARDGAKADMYLRYIANRAILGMRDGLLGSALNPREFDRKDLWTTAVQVLKEEFDGNTEVRELLREHVRRAQENAYAPPSNPRSNGRGRATAPGDDGGLLPWLRSLGWPPSAAPRRRPRP